MPKKTITYRLMCAEEDEREFYGLMGKFFALLKYRREIGYRISNAAGRMWVVALLTDEVIGFGSFGVDRHGVGHLYDAWVTEKYRKKDVYRTILNLQMNWFKDHCVTEIWAIVPPYLLERFSGLGFEAETFRGKYAYMKGSPKEWV